MSRPLMQHGVGQLEEMFAKGKADPALLKQLESELRHRQVPRALTLLAEVEVALSGMTAAPRAPAGSVSPQALPSGSIPQQPSLFERTAAPSVLESPPPAPVHVITPAVKPPDDASVTKMPTSSKAMPLEVAYKVLNTTAGTTWESVEQTRRTLVQLSHPSLWKSLSAEKRAQALSEANRVNTAYFALAQARCGER